MKKLLTTFVVLLILTGCQESGSLSTTLVFKLPRPTSLTTITRAEISNSYHTLIRTDTLERGILIYEWDKKDDRGNLVVPGIYLVRVLDHLNNEIASGAVVAGNGSESGQDQD
ncbi:MAG: lipoprotein [Bacteroidetes bacterium]|nr:lipoprotein [Bacteroidota bacterium]